MGATELPLPRTIVHQKQSCIPGIAETSATIKDLKDAGVVIPTFLISLPVRPVQKIDGSRRMTLYYCKLNQMVASVQLLYQMWLHCLSKLTHPLVPSMQLLSDKCFFSVPVNKTTRSSLLLPGKARSTPSLSCLRGI